MSAAPDAPDAEPAPPPTPAARIERPSDEVEHPAGTARLPGARRDGYTRLPTGPVGIEPVVVTGPDIDAPEETEWEPSTGTVSIDDTRLAPWALVAAIVARLQARIAAL